MLTAIFRYFQDFNSDDLQRPLLTDRDQHSYIDAFGTTATIVLINSYISMQLSVYICLLVNITAKHCC